MKEENDFVSWGQYFKTDLETEHFFTQPRLDANKIYQGKKRNILNIQNYFPRGAKLTKIRLFFNKGAYSFA